MVKFLLLFKSPGPINLVLDAIQGFYPPGLRHRDVEFDFSVGSLVKD